MKINTIKRNTKGKPLTHTEFDNNWTTIETAINEKQGRLLYEIVDVEQSFNNGESTTSLSLQIKIKLLEDVEVVPILKACATINCSLKVFSGPINAFEGNNFPLPANDEVSNSINMIIPINEEDWPALLKVYISDDAGNFCNTYEQFYLNELP